MNENQQQHNFEYLQTVVEHQLKVRNCEIEGMVFNLKAKLTTAFELGLISMHQLDQLEGQL